MNAVPCWQPAKNYTKLIVNNTPMKKDNENYQAIIANICVWSIVLIELVVVFVIQ